MGGLDVTDLDVMHLRRGRSLAAPGQHLRHRVIVTLVVSEHGAVGLVADPADQLEPNGLLRGVPAEGHALHLAGDLDLQTWLIVARVLGRRPGVSGISWR